MREAELSQDVLISHSPVDSISMVPFHSRTSRPSQPWDIVVLLCITASPTHNVGVVKAASNPCPAKNRTSTQASLSPQSSIPWNEHDEPWFTLLSPTCRLREKEDIVSASVEENVECADSVRYEQAIESSACRERDWV